MGRALAWLARVPKRDRDFIRQYGAYAVGRDLQQLLGWTGAQVDLARRAFKAMPSQNGAGRRVAFSTLFEARRGRPPDLADFPPPRYYPARRGWQWTEPEEELLRALHGLEPPERVAHELSRLLATITGDECARRTRAAVQAHAGQLGLDGRILHGKRGLLVKDAARLSGIGAHTIYKAIQDRDLATFGRAKYRFIPWPDWIRWRDRHLAAQERRRRSIATLPEKCVTAHEARRRLGIGESHLGRLLKGKVLRAWKIGGRWHISARCIAEVRRARKRGSVSLETPAFARLREKANEKHRALRRRQRTEPGHTRKAQPGFLTPVEVGFQAGVSYATVYADVKSGVLAAARQGPASRERYEVAAADALAYIEWIKAEPNYHLRRHQRLVRRVHEQGLITKNEAMQLLGVKPTQLLRLIAKGDLRPVKVSGRTAFCPGEVCELRDRRRRVPIPIGMACTIERLRPAGYLTVSEVAHKTGQKRWAVERHIAERVLRVSVVPCGRVNLRYVPGKALKAYERWLCTQPLRGERRRAKRRACLVKQGLITTEEAARVLGVQRGTVIAYVRQGKLRARVCRRAGFGFHPDDIQRFARRRGRHRMNKRAPGQVRRAHSSHIGSSPSLPGANECLKRLRRSLFVLSAGQQADIGTGHCQFVSRLGAVRGL